MRVPDWWAAILLALAAWRTFQLLVHDDVLDWPRRRLLRLGEWKQDGDPVPPTYRSWLGEWLKCPYCFGFHLSLVIYLFWLWFPTETLVVCTPLALNVGVIALHRIFNE